MTIANKITLARIGLIPVFVLFAIYYGQGVLAGDPQEALRWAAVGTFALAAASDGLDGWLARRLNQRTELGVVLDPIADKGLLIAGIMTLSFCHWTNALPVWFAVLVVARDVAVLAGIVGVFALHGKVNLRPHWTGKTATALQMLSLTGVMLQPEWLVVPCFSGWPSTPFVWVRNLDVLVIVTGVFTLVSGFGYLGEGIAQAHRSGHGDPSGQGGGKPD
jgi:CDP-diacylglycerol--glycerol-3-phosphate 3-phosphatidyltransferase